MCNEKADAVDDIGTVLLLVVWLWNDDMVEEEDDDDEQEEEEINWDEDGDEEQWWWWWLLFNIAHWFIQLRLFVNNNSWFVQVGRICKLVDESKSSTDNGVKLKLCKWLVGNVE